MVHQFLREINGENPEEEDDDSCFLDGLGDEDDFSEGDVSENVVGADEIQSYGGQVDPHSDHPDFDVGRLHYYDYFEGGKAAPAGTSACDPWGDLGGDVWWEKPGHLFPMLIRADGLSAGFLLVMTAPFVEPGLDFEVAALFVRPSQRRRGIARSAVRAALGRFEGHGEAIPADDDALCFWDRVLGDNFSEYRLDPDGDGFLFENVLSNRKGCSL